LTRLQIGRHLKRALKPVINSSLGLLPLSFNWWGDTTRKEVACLETDETEGEKRERDLT